MINNVLLKLYIFFVQVKFFSRLVRSLRIIFFREVVAVKHDSFSVDWRFDIMETDLFLSVVSSISDPLGRRIKGCQVLGRADVVARVRRLLLVVFGYLRQHNTFFRISICRLDRSTYKKLMRNIKSLFIESYYFTYEWLSNQCCFSILHKQDRRRWFRNLRNFYFLLRNYE